MRIFKEAKYTFYSNDSLETLIENFKKNVEPIKGFNLRGYRTTKKKYEGSIAKTYFILNKVNDMNTSFGTDYEGNIVEENGKLKITITASTPAQVKVIFWFMTVMCLIFFLISASHSFKLDVFSYISLAALAVQIGIVLIFNSIRSNINFKPIERVFQNH